jgi:glutaredoxin
MDKKIVWTTVIISIVIVILGYILVDSANKKNITKATSDLSVTLPAKDKIVFYYGITCPHCKDVEEWMEKNKIEEKIKVEKKEVYENKKNSDELSLVAKSCNLDPTAIGVPFLWADGKCYIGTPDVERVLGDKLNSKNQNAK